jgi:hypothetical protein
MIIQTFYRDVMGCEAEEQPENDAQTSLMSLAGRKGVLYQAQLYEDPDVWTLPLPLTRGRAEMLLEDDSVSQIKLIIESKL